MCLFCRFYLYRSAHSLQCVKCLLLSLVGCAHWRAACSAAGFQGLSRAASEVRFRGEKQQPPSGIEGGYEQIIRELFRETLSSFRKSQLSSFKKN